MNNTRFNNVRIPKTKRIAIIENTRMIHESIVTFLRISQHSRKIRLLNQIRLEGLQIMFNTINGFMVALGVKRLRDFQRREVIPAKKKTGDYNKEPQ